ncbi:hypothetical protein [Viridibacillus arvi]|uniref:hypothetical protein n=1 Tax=Viridibacillus arvi TaxID=263475 RepID=UPI0036E1A7FB
MARCIYCNSIDISDSDIIPVSLTNAKITKKNVCKSKHNNDFGKTFESDVINKLSFIRDHLDITTKSKKYPETMVEIIVDDVSLKKIITKSTNIFDNKLIGSEDNKTKVGPLEKINILADSARRKGKQVGTIKEININEKVVETKFKVDLKAFISRSAKRLIAKMAYEWYCYFYNIEEYLEEFADIINFICEDEWKDKVELVTYVADKRLYNVIRQHTSHGSHTFITYENDSSINVLVSFFGICLYNVKLLNKPCSRFNKNCFLQEFQLSSTRKTLEQQSIYDFKLFLRKSLQTLNGSIFYPKEESMNNHSWDIIGLYFNIIKLIDSKKFLSEENEQLVGLVIENLQETMNGNLLHIRNLKRFAKECIDNKEEIQLNPHAFGGGKILLYYLVYKIGINNYLTVNDEVIKQILSNKLNVNTEIILSRDLEKELLLEVMNDENYSEILKLGSKKILDAPFD